MDILVGAAALVGVGAGGIAVVTVQKWGLPGVLRRIAVWILAWAQAIETCKRERRGATKYWCDYLGLKS